MAKDFPNSYKDPLYASLDAKTESKLGLPAGLLASVRLNGEKSNHDQVSSAAAKSPYQFIPSTAAAIEKKYGIDPLLSPENASEAAGLLLKEGLERNQGDPRLAVAEYTGGIDRKNWGPVTRAYVDRVTKPLKLGSDAPLAAQTTAATQAPPAAPVAPVAPGGSTFDRVMASRTPAQDSIANVFQAYKSGQMSPDESAQFEQDVKDGKMMLPKGGALQSAAAPAPGPMELPAGVIDAYATGKMSPQEKAQLVSDVEANRVRMPKGVQLGETVSSAQITNLDRDPNSVQPLAPAEPTLGQKVIGAGEAGLTALTGAVGGTAGTLGGTAIGIAKSVLDGTYGTQDALKTVEDYASKGGDALTYMPRGDAGQGYVRDVLAPVAQELMPLAGLNGEIANIAALGKALPGTRGTAALTRQIPGDVRESLPGRAAVPEVAPVPEVPVATRVVPEVAPAPVVPTAAPVPEAVPTSSRTPSRAESPTGPGGVTGEDLAATGRKAGDGGIGSNRAMEVLAEEASPNPKIVADAKRIGIEDHLQPDHVTTSQAFREFSQAVKSTPGSITGVEESAGLKLAGQKAVDLIEKIGGTTDLSELSGDVRSHLDVAAKKFGDQADALWTKLRKEIPDATRVETPATTRALQETVAALGGEEQALKALPATASKFLKPLLNGDEVTHGYLDNARKQIGQAMERASGPFADMESGQLKRLYGTLTSDQERAATQASKQALITFQAAKYATRLQKGLEDDLSSLFGKELTKSFVGGGEYGLKGATKAASEGDFTKIVKLMQVTPPELRQRVVASGIATVFRNAGTSGDINFGTYAKWYDGLRRNRQAYAAVMTNLPLSARKQLAALHSVATGISAATKEHIGTGRIQSVQQALAGADTLMARMYGFARRASVGVAAEAGTSAVGLPGVGLASGITSALMSGKPKIFAAVDGVISSPEFLKLAKAPAGPAKVAATKQLAYSKPFMKFSRAAGNPPELKNRERWVQLALAPKPEPEKAKK